ncbi:MAG TPA: IPT/TIG domain-containing protein [Kofleriaceae bacterium]
MTRRSCIFAVCAACGAGSGSPPTIDSASPAFGPLGGGSIVQISGAGFLSNAAAPNHVLVGGVESSLASVVDDSTLQFLLPAGVQAGDATIQVFNQNGQGSATGIFHYSSTPSVGSISPSSVMYSSMTTLTVTGSGFQDEDAGVVTVLVDGAPAIDVAVQSDSQLTFTALPADPLVAPTVEVVDNRGNGSLARAYRYVPGANPGLVLFPNDGRTFFTFLDPVAGTTLSVPLHVSGYTTHIRSTVQDADGTIRGLRSDGAFGAIDFATQSIVSPVLLDERFPAAVEVAGNVYGMSSDREGLVTIDETTGQVQQIGPSAFPCCGYGIAADATGTVYFVGPQTSGPVAISTVDVTTGARGSATPLSPSVRVQELRFLNGTLYGASGPNIIKIDPMTGSNSVVQTFSGTITAMEVFQ